MQYPERVVMAVTEPASGLPAKLKWLPSVAEIVEACDAERNRLFAPIQRERAAMAQLADRRRLDAFESQSLAEGKVRVAAALARFKAGRDGDPAQAKASERERAMARLLELGAEAGVTRQMIEGL